jgi:arginine/lysine/ornithine decarboxylase
MSRLSDHVRETLSADGLSFHMPGHKGAGGAPAAGLELFGPRVYELDLSELGGFDYLHGTEAAIARAQDRAAALFGADRSWFLVNGATVGNLAAIVASAGDGDGVLMARASHRSVYAGVVLAGARPVYLPAVANAELDGLFGIRVEDVAAALDDDPSIRAVHVTSPSFYGFTLPIADLARMTSARGVTLIVDEAHGSHFAFHPDLPTPALDAGADIVVHSPHKTLGSLTQSALLHVRGPLVDVDRVDQALQMLQSSSPSSLLIVSIDVALEEMTGSGEQRWGRAVELAEGVRRGIGQSGAVRAYGPEVVGTPGIHGVDPIKIVIDVSGLGTTGFVAADWLRSARQVWPEFADLRRLVCSITPADSADSCARLVQAVADLASAPLEQHQPALVASRWPHHAPAQACTPREATQHATEDVAIHDAVGRTVAEMVIPYPPGMPLLVPGEVVSAEVVDAVEQLVVAGARLVGVASPKATTLRCLTPR